jgi:hypothetical protein
MKKNLKAMNFWGLVLPLAAVIFTSCPPPPIEMFILPPKEEFWYYAATYGNDANDGLTPDTAVKTFTRALEKAAMDIERPRIYILDALDGVSENRGAASETFLFDGAAVRKEITLDGENGAGLRGEGGAKNVLRVINGGHIIIRTISLEDGDTGLVLEGGSGAVMEDGLVAHNRQGVLVTGGSSFLMEGGSVEVNFDTTPGYGGGVDVTGLGSSFIMRGGASISGNTADYGAAVRVENHAKFEMEGFVSISGNTSLAASDNSGCVYANNYASIGMKGSAAVQDNAARAGVVVEGRSSFFLEEKAAVTNTAGGSGVYVNNYSELKMSGTSRITDNTGDGVNLKDGSSFIMQENAVISGNSESGVDALGITVVITDRAEISDNKDSGVYLLGCSAVISGNAVITWNETFGDGGGVRAEGGELTITDNAAISHNTAAFRGGGLYCFTGAATGSQPGLDFILSGNAIVSGNEAGGNGGGVYLKTAGFIMGGEARIQDNKTNSPGGGGGVTFDGGDQANPGSIFVLQGGVISGNKALSGYGGGVLLEVPDLTYGIGLGGPWADFKMYGGEISGNAANKGGGVAIQYKGTLLKSGPTSGVIYGTNAALSLQNTAASEGDAIWTAADEYNATYAAATRSTTVNSGENLALP